MKSEEQMSLFDDNPEYRDFVEKFKPKLTTDDCYTPQNVYDAVAEWVAQEYDLDPAGFVRPFWPGEDYRRADYPAGCCVVDNPPFSIRAKILDWYMERGIPFFLFSPALTLLSRRRDLCHIATAAEVTYQNGAVVKTSFVTNLEPDCALRTAPALKRAVEAADLVNRRAEKKELPKYSYPDEVITAAIAQRWCHYGIDYRLTWKDCRMIGALDAQRKEGKSIFGGGLLLSERAAVERAAVERAAAERAAAERAAAERAAAERAAAIRWPLSMRERELVRELGE